MEKQEEEKQVKERCILEIREALPRYADRLVGIDQRIYDYALDVVRTDIDIHCLDEILGLRKFLRLLDTYQFDLDTFKDVLYDAEGEWEMGTPPKHIRGGLKIEGIYGYGYYRQTRLQVFSYANIYGFYTWKDTTSPVGSREMMPSEKAGENGTIWDYRRLITNFILFWPRKVAKTFSGAFIQYEGMVNACPARQDSLMFEFDYEGYIAANSSDQAKLLFTMLKKFITQFPDYRRYFKINDSPQNRTIAWKGTTGIPAFVKALSSNPDNKDGLKASGLSADEIGAADGEESDMERIVNVVEGSRGPRRNPLTVHTSTAGLGIETTYEQMINSEHDALMREMEIPLDGNPHKTPDDWHGAIMLRPDAWERGDDELLRSERVIRKVNPNLGVTIQPSFYEDEWRLADLRGELKRKEVITKLYNIFAADRAKQWVTGEKIRRLMRPMRIEECTEDDGWQMFAGIDFALMADLNICAFLARRRRENGSMQYHAGLRAFMSEEGIQQNRNKGLLKKYAERGWLHVLKCRSDEEFYKLPVEAIIEMLDKGVCFVGVGYDPYKAAPPINYLKEYLFAEFGTFNEKICEIVRPVRQNFANFNPLVIELDYLLNGDGADGDEPMLTFEENGLWSWCAENMLLAESNDGMQNRKPIKVSPDQKIDPYIGLMEALCMADWSDNKIYDVGEE